MIDKPPLARTSATAIGMLAIPVWALLPTLTVFAGAVPPLELVALTFTLGAAVGAVFLAVSREARRSVVRLGIAPVLLGLAGLFGYHFCYFLALQNAPAVEASLVNYLWPVLIVLFSSALPASAGAGRLTAWHFVGAMIAFAGAALAITGGTSLTLSGNGFGYGMALAAALTWSSFSVATRLFRNVPSAAVTVYCAGTAAIAWATHFVFEPTVWPTSIAQIAAIVGLGLGPVGAAFYVWDYGCKHGDLRVLGVSAYFAPVLSTAILIATGLAQPRPALILAASLITVGAMVASKDLVMTAFANRKRKAGWPGQARP